MLRRIVFLAWMIAFGSCRNNDSSQKDELLASAYDKKLYRSQVEWLLPAGSSAEDSLLILKAYIDRWLKDELLMYEAERNIPKDLNIDQLVRDYRASLIRHSFEEQIVAEKLDSTVSEAELRQFYEENKEQFELESTILKCYLLKMPNEAPQAELNKIWYARDLEKLRRFSSQWATLSLLEPSKWYHLEEIAAFLPKGTLTKDNINSRREGTLSDDGFRFYYRIFEVVQGKETAPFEFVSDQCRRMILHQRKKEVLEKWKKEIFEKAQRQGNLKTY